jgi:hypothetical protein
VLAMPLTTSASCLACWPAAAAAQTQGTTRQAAVGTQDIGWELVAWFAT